MAAITFTTPTGGRVVSVPVAADATTRTNYFLTPSWARYAQVFFSATVITTSTALSLITTDPVRLDDTYNMLLKEIAAFTAITGITNLYCIDIGPGVSGIADDVTMAAAADSYSEVNAILPPVLGVTQANTGASTYQLTVAFRP